MSSRAWAHPMDLATLTITPVDDRLRFELRLHERAVARIVNLGHPNHRSVVDIPHADTGTGTGPGTEAKSIARGQLESYARLLFTLTLETGTVFLDGQPCLWANPELTIAADDSTFLNLRVVAICSSSRTEPFFLQLNLPFLKDSPREFQIIAKIASYADNQTPRVLSATSTTAEFGKKESVGLGGFFAMGMAHIGVMPSEWRGRDGTIQVAEGIDHVCFLLAIVLASTKLFELLKSVTGFTIGHSLTLGLSAFKIIHVHSIWVEVAIAFSIFYSAANTLFRPNSRDRWIVAAIFGTIHGLGFASALQELQLSTADTWRALIGFNLGIEFAQLTIVLFVFPALALLARRHSRSQTWVTRIGSSILAGAGGYWLILRLMTALTAL